MARVAESVATETTGDGTQVIAYEQQGVKPARPLTHDLMRDILAALQAPLRAVEITELKENTYFALVYLNVSGRQIAIDSRPSDAIALAVRTSVPTRTGVGMRTETENDEAAFAELMRSTQPRAWQRLTASSRLGRASAWAEASNSRTSSNGALYLRWKRRAARAAARAFFSPGWLCAI